MFIIDILLMVNVQDKYWYYIHDWLIELIIKLSWLYKNDLFYTRHM